MVIGELISGNRDESNNEREYKSVVDYVPRVDAR